MAENHLDFIFMKKDSKDSQIYRVGEPELAGLLLAIPVASADANAFNDAINNYLGTITGLNVLLRSTQPAELAKTAFNHAADIAVPSTAQANDVQFKPSVYFNKANDVRFGHMYPVTFDATGEVEAPTDAATGNSGQQAEYVTLSFTPEEIATLKLINKGLDVANLATKIQLVIQSFHLLYDKIPVANKTDADTKITVIINGAVADADGATFKTYCGVLVDLGKAYTNTNSENFDGVSVELDINYPVAPNATPVIIDQRPITDQTDVNHLLNFAKICLGAKLTGLGGLLGGKRKRNKKSSKRRSQKKSRKSKKRSNKRKSRKSRRIRRKSYKK
jgi:hypothetical protein